MNAPGSEIRQSHLAVLKVSTQHTEQQDKSNSDAPSPAAAFLSLLLQLRDFLGGNFLSNDFPFGGGGGMNHNRQLYP